jgi:phosphopantothenate-cysteine ligase
MMESSAVSEEDLDFLAVLTTKEKDDLQLQIEEFVVDHALHHRPVCLVSSGGTAADLEINAVRSLDNFSTGLRGAISVEELLKRGYAVIHLWRTGSASPFARVLNQFLGLQQANHALNMESLGRLFADETDEDLVQTVLDQEKDPWLSRNQTSVSTRHSSSLTSSTEQDIALNRGLLHSTWVHRALRERREALTEGRILTVPFRTVDEYLAKLQLAAQVLSATQSLAMFFLAAAVSDFYIPRSERAEHKIQSAGNQGLTLHLKPVPKVLGYLRREWAPDAFVVSFKLETDKDILRQKAERAVERYGCHMVIGNLLQTRHEKVWLLHPEDQRNKAPESAKDWPFTAISIPKSSTPDALEASVIDFVVEQHFEFISWHFHVGGSGTKAAEKAHQLLQEKKERVQRAQFWKQVKSVGLEVGATVLAILISYSVNSALRKRL